MVRFKLTAYGLENHHSICWDTPAYCGKWWIWTTVPFKRTDLQSVAFNHSANFPFFCIGKYIRTTIKGGDHYTTIIIYLCMSLSERWELDSWSLRWQRSVLPLNYSRIFVEIKRFELLISACKTDVITILTNSPNLCLASWTWTNAHLFPKQVWYHTSLPPVVVIHKKNLSIFIVRFFLKYIFIFYDKSYL